MLRSCDKYKQWIKDVFSRDNFTCQECFKRGTYLEAHHEKRFSIIMKEFLSLYDQFSPIEDKETLLRLAIKYEPFWTLENGKTMCSKCHNLTKGAIHGS
jgi:5-methylcytosine-specific restriction endonuclease McrA